MNGSLSRKSLFALLTGAVSVGTLAAVVKTPPTPLPNPHPLTNINPALLQAGTRDPLKEIDDLRNQIKAIWSNQSSLWQDLINAASSVQNLQNAFYNHYHQYNELHNGQVSGYYNFTWKAQWN